MSHPLRVRGLKLSLRVSLNLTSSVAPLAGAWIETDNREQVQDYKRVAPLAGAWIETGKSRAVLTHQLVAPLAGAWIETLYLNHLAPLTAVAPLAGAWIETFQRVALPTWSTGRTPCGCVD